MVAILFLDSEIIIKYLLFEVTEVMKVSVYISVKTINFDIFTGIYS